MSAKYEIKTLQQGLHTYSDVPAADLELAAHLNDDWGILNLTVIENFGFDGPEGAAYPVRVVTLRREIPIAHNLPYNPAVMALPEIQSFMAEGKLIDASSAIARKQATD